MTRNTNFQLGYTSVTGFNIAGTIVPAFSMTFSPLGVSVWASLLNSISIALPNIAEIAALFERVRIDKVEIDFQWTTEDSGTGASTALQAAGPRLLASIDYTDGQNGSSLAQIQQQEGCRFYSGTSDKPNRFTIRPKFQRLVYFTATTSSFEPAVGFVAADSDIPHYGVRMGAVAPGNVGQGQLQFNMKYYLTCKNIK